MDIILCLVLFVMAILAIALVRNQLVYKYQVKALQETSKKAKLAMDDDGDWREHYTKLDSYGTYDKMFLDVRKWTYKQFYPDL